MWDCGQCGCLAIAAGLAACPMCGKERIMPRITAGGGASNADADWEAAGETGAEPMMAAMPPGDGAPEPVVTPEPELAAETVPGPQEPPGPSTPPESSGASSGPDDDDDGPADYAAIPIRILRDLCRDRDLSPTGAKAELVDRLAEYDEQQAGVAR